MSQYDLSESDLTRIADAFNHAEQEAKNKSNGGKSVTQSIRHAQSELESVCPEIWWTNRDYEFDDICEKVKSIDSDVERRHEIVQDFHLHVIDLIYNELSIEP